MKSLSKEWEDDLVEEDTMETIRRTDKNAKSKLVIKDIREELSLTRKRMGTNCY